MKGIKLTIIVLIVLLFIGGGTFTYLYLKSDFFLTNQQAFLKYLAQEENVFNNFSKYYEIQQVNEESYSSNAEIEMNVEIEEDISVGANINTVKDGSNIFSEISTSYQEEEFLSFNYLKEADKHGIQFPGIKQYVVLENDNLKEFAKNLGLEDENALKLIPNKILGLKPDKLVELSDEEKEQIKNLVMNAINGNITKEKYAKEDNVNIEFNKQNIKATGYSIELTEKEMLNISKNIFEEVKGNETLLNLLESKIDYILYGEEVDILTIYLRLGIGSSLLLQSGMNNLLSESQEEIEEEVPSFEINREIIVQGLENAIENLQEEIIGYTEEDKNSIKVTVYQNSGKIIKLKLEQNNEQEQYSFLSEDEESETIMVNNIIEIDNLENEVNKSNILVTIKSYVDEELQQGQAMQLIIENQEETSILKEQIQDLKEEKILTTSEMQVSRVGQTIKTEGKVVTNQEELSVNITYTNTIQIGNNHIKETLENNEVVLNDLSFKQIEKIFTRIKERLEKEIQKKFPEFSFGEGNSTLELLEKAEEAKKSNENAQLLDAINLAVAQLTIEEMENYTYDNADIEENGKLTNAIRDNYPGDIIITEKNGNLEVRDTEDNNIVVIIELTNNEITNISSPML